MLTGIRKIRIVVKTKIISRNMNEMMIVGINYQSPKFKSYENALRGLKFIRKKCYPHAYTYVTNEFGDWVIVIEQNTI